jgi:hypothetical protein
MVVAAVSPAKPTVIFALALAAACVPATAGAAPPPNDSPAAPGSFQPYSAENGQPTELTALAELAEATPDAGVPRCLGASSFARTVWYSIPAAATPHELSVEASGETLDVVDLAAFVQSPDAATAVTTTPNACDGLGAGGAAAAEEPTSGIALRVPAGRAVLVQVGRRGPVGTPEEERAVLSVDDRAIPSPPVGPTGDVADPATPPANAGRTNVLPLFGATLTGEDPAEPPCPALASVWRKVVPGKAGPRLISATGDDAATLTAFAGPVPRQGNALDCVNRTGRGALQLLVQGRPQRPLWIRVGTDDPAQSSSAGLRVASGARAFVADGGPGGFDPTPGGPGGGLPADCDKADARRASVGGPRFGGQVKQLNRRRSLGIAIVLRRGPVCDVEARLLGPGGRIYARARALRIKGGRRRISLRRTGYKLAKGNYRLQITALSRLGDRVSVRSSLKGKLA